MINRYQLMKIIINLRTCSKLKIFKKKISFFNQKFNNKIKFNSKAINNDKL